ncbi:MAG: hypothetical protein IPI02_08935 [Sterolibacteriaceae bacterium]|nr:hypothetical protein [Sterolibacteriaceae bacterium]
MLSPVCSGVLDELPAENKPKLVRGDNAFGCDAMMTALEQRGQPYLFKLKLSKNVKRHIVSVFRQSGWTDAGQGWEGRWGACPQGLGEESSRRRAAPAADGRDRGGR